MLAVKIVLALLRCVILSSLMCSTRRCVSSTMFSTMWKEIWPPRQDFGSFPPYLIFEIKIRYWCRRPRRRETDFSKSCNGFGSFWAVLEASNRLKLRCYWKTGAFKTRPNPLQLFVDALRIRKFPKSWDSQLLEKIHPRAWNLWFCENPINQK